MPRLKAISLQIRFLLLGLSLLSVLSLDKREVAIYLEKPAKEQTVKASPDQLIIKEKVSFEAVTSFIVLPDAIFPDLISFDFSLAPSARQFITFAVPVASTSFQRLLATSISPNAPWVFTPFPLAFSVSAESKIQYFRLLVAAIPGGKISISENPDTWYLLPDTLSRFQF